jgi:hypothetical protein
MNASRGIDLKFIGKYFAAEFFEEETHLKFKMILRKHEFPFTTASLGRKMFILQNEQTKEICTKYVQEAYVPVLKKMFLEITSKFNLEESLRDYTFAADFQSNRSINSFKTKVFLVTINRKTMKTIGSRAFQRKHDWKIENYIASTNKIIRKRKEDAFSDIICRLLLENGFNFGPTYFFQNYRSTYSRNIDYTVNHSLRQSLMFLIAQPDVDVNKRVFYEGFRNHENVFQVAVSRGYSKEVKTMLSLGKVDWDASSDVLHIHNAGAHNLITQVLLEHLKQQPISIMRKVLNARVKGKTPLMKELSLIGTYVVNSDAIVDSCNALIRAGSDYKAIYEGKTSALDLIPLRGKKWARLGLKFDQAPEIMLQDDLFWHPILIAARDGNFESCKKLSSGNALLIKTQYGQRASELTTDPKIKRYLEEKFREVFHKSFLKKRKREESEDDDENKYNESF